MEPVEIIEDGLLLRPWREDDAEAVHRACQDPDIQRWTGVPRPYLPEHALNFVTGSAPAAWAAGTGAQFAVCDAATGELLASCGLVSIDPGLGSAEIGYWTAPWARGREVAVRATRAVARWAFDVRKLRRLIWQAEIGNHASRLVALRAGFRLEGELRLAQPPAGGRREGWLGSLLPGEVPAPGEPGPAGPGTLAARRAAVFGHPQPVLFASAGATELRLRPMEERDLDAVVTTCQDEQTVRWTGVPHPYQREHAEGYLRDVVQAAWARGTAASYVVADPDDHYVASIDLRLSPADPLVADVGFMTAPHARGRGYLPAALAALCAWGFTTLGLARIEWRANVGNTASRRVAEKAGFVIEGTSRSGIQQRTERPDTWVGALLPGDLA
ncbi:Protein N-acetyltransferase, RimJ/RimL family [Micromonospora viridifaciens]|uniref:Protein N-acetyltransferase, RimJ/RimL family n=1 Tax=Micromonospora viridifaciens TaxID=1881 RepID=A0A1C4ZR86_MICVI|nr:GNAT family N-acetyltransferase [Micromonospora viridifaciens]SCF35550.1 Protein N-acetyltransferase, RimJ/RimL family [Micromonospora viridifaciens]